MKLGEYDVHVATEGLSGIEELAEKLRKMGFRDDRLTHRNITYLEGVPTSSCPLIGIHVTKKGHKDMTEIRAEMEALYDLVSESGQQGYAHAEFTRDEDDVIIKSVRPFKFTQPWPVQKLEAKLKPQNKRWDLHIAMPKDSIPTQLQEILSHEMSGFYHIDILKTRDGKDREFRIYTIQGINRYAAGKELSLEIRRWFEEVNVPHAEMKLEVTVDMWRIGDPLIVPPTIDQVQYYRR